MPKDRIAVATTGLASFSRILTSFGHESIDFPTSQRLPLLEQQRLENVLLRIGYAAEHLSLSSNEI